MARAVTIAARGRALATGPIQARPRPVAITAAPRLAPTATASPATEVFMAAAMPAAAGPTPPISQVWRSGTTTKALPPHQEQAQGRGSRLVHEQALCHQHHRERRQGQGQHASDLRRLDAAGQGGARDRPRAIHQQGERHAGVRQTGHLAQGGCHVREGRDETGQREHRREQAEQDRRPEHDGDAVRQRVNAWPTRHP
jgi:hypothetical protein